MTPQTGGKPERCFQSASFRISNFYSLILQSAFIAMSEQPHASTSSISNHDFQSASTSAARRGRHHVDAAPTSEWSESDGSDTRARRARLNRRKAVPRSPRNIAPARRSKIRSSRRRWEQKRQSSSVRSRLADAKTHAAAAGATSDEAAAASTARVHAPPRHRSKYRSTLSVNTIAKKFQVKE